MPLRFANITFVASAGVFAILVAYNNIVDYQSNFEFVQHVLSMDTTFEHNRLKGRAIEAPWVHHFGYGAIIAAEAATGLLCCFGAWQLWRFRSAGAAVFQKQKTWPTYGLTLGILLWSGGFMTVGGEWFVMWQSDIWNGQEAAFRFIMILFATLITLHLPEQKEDVRIG